MSNDPWAQALLSAESNLRRLASWLAANAARSKLSGHQAVLVDAIRSDLDALSRWSRTEIQSLAVRVDEPAPRAEGQGNSLRDHRLTAAATYLDGLRRALCVRSVATTSPEGRRALAWIAQHLDDAVSACDRMLTASMVTPDPDGPAAEAADDSHLPVADPLVLRDSFEAPLLQRLDGGRTTLSPLVREDVDRFLEESHVGFDDGQRRAFDARLTEWIEATPDGQELVLKIGWPRGRRGPYPSYRPVHRPDESSDHMLYIGIR